MTAVTAAQTTQAETDPAANARHRSMFPLLFLTSSAGLLLVALAFDSGRSGHAIATPLLWIGLMAILLPSALRLLAADTPRTERLGIVVLLGLALYAVKVLQSPVGFTLHDELGQYRSVADILRTGKLYVDNPLVRAYSFYPGLLSATAALARVSGLDIFPAGLIVVGVARLLVTGGLFLVVERVSRSARVAGLAVLIYTANPNFVFFDSQFAYESLAIGLGALTLLAAVRATDRGTQGWTDLVLAAALDAALVLSHHLTSYAVALFLCLWLILELARPAASSRRGRLALLALVSVAFTGAYAVFAYHATASDIGGSITGSFHGLFDTISGRAAGRAPFSSAPGYTDPVTVRVVGVASVVLLLAALPFGLVALVRRRPPERTMWILALAAVAYPFSLALRLSSAGAETSNRASEFVFLGLGTVLAVAFFTWLAPRILARGRRSALTPLVLLFVGIVFTGGIFVGTPTYGLLPGPFEVSAGNRSIDAEGVSAARWANAHSTPGEYFFADEPDTELLTAYTHLHPQTGVVNGTGIGALFLSTTFGAFERSIISTDKLKYLVVDERDSSARPRSGRYFDSATPKSGYPTTISPSALAKFDQATCLDRVYDSGHVVIYGTQRLFEGCQ